jgi:amino acid adenylation domain-containing protein
MGNLETSSSDSVHIAIVGMACRVPGAESVEDFWRNLAESKESLTFFTDEEIRAAGIPKEVLHNPRFVKAWAALGDIKGFDAGFFGFTPREAELMDPQQRIFLEVAWSAMEAAGYDPLSYPRRIGLYAGLGNTEYVSALLSDAQLVEAVGKSAIIIANDRSSVATTTSYKLNLRGPSVAVQAACSTSLVAVHLACQSLLEGECDMALAGGAAVTVPEIKGYLHEEGGVLSSDGHCRAFDHRANGMVGGSGACVVLLKRLPEAMRDRDHIHALIRGSAINNDGSLKLGYAAPSIEGQAMAITAAHAVAEVEAETISYVEAHGTGTALGDPVEVAALTQAFRKSTAKKQFCALGSAKTNIGHLDTAAGAAGLIKTVLALQHKKIPASLNFDKPNPKIDFDNSPFFVNTALRDWTGPKPLRAGVSSFGVGGTNAHVVLEEAPEPQPAKQGRAIQLLVLSARTANALDNAAHNLARHLKQNPETCLADAAYTLQVGRKQFAHRLAVVCRTPEAAVAGLERRSDGRFISGVAPESSPAAVFMFPGQGAQFTGMLQEQYEEESFFRSVVDRCCEQLVPALGLDLRAIIYPDGRDREAADKKLTQTAIAQPALFVIEYAMALFWMKLGVTPKAMIGHSLGEYVAAGIAGVMAESELLHLIATRARLMQQMVPGSMLAVALSEDEARLRISSGVSLAAINGAQQCVLSGSTDAVEALEKQLQAEEIACRRLPTSHAFHSSMMEPMLEKFSQELNKVKLCKPHVPFLSNLTGKWITEREATDPQYWLRHLREPVRFADGVSKAAEDLGACVWLEVGPGQALSGIVRKQLGPKGPAGVIASSPVRGQSEHGGLVESVAKVWAAGVAVDWSAFQDGTPHRVPLPTYPFERQRYWINPSAGVSPRNQTTTREKTQKGNIEDWFYVPLWKQSLFPRHLKQREPTNWLVFADDEGLGAEMGMRLAAIRHNVVLVRPGKKFVQMSPDAYILDPQKPDDYQALLSHLLTQGREPKRIAYFWGIADDEGGASGSIDQYSGFASLLFLTQALVKQELTGGSDLVVVSNGMHLVTGQETVLPEKSLLLGPCLVVPQEVPGIRCRNIDLVLHRPEDKERETLIENLLRELVDGSEENIVCYRGLHRWVKHYEAVKIGPAAGVPASLREGGVYLITGGLGQIGLEVAAYLARTAHARLVLVGRSAFPKPEDWQTWLASHELDDPVSRKILRLQELQCLGAEVLVMSADVSELQDMHEVVLQTQTRFGPIHGVIHAAGWVGKNALPTFMKTDIQVCEAHLRSKARGVVVLEEVLRDQSLDFCVLFSSVSTMLGGIGFCAYASANLFVDAVAQRRKQQHSRIWTSVNWEGWNFGQGTGPVTASGDSVRELSMTPGEGIEALHRILAMQEPFAQVVVATGDLPSRISKWVQATADVSMDRSKGGSKSRVHDGADVNTSEIERQIGEIWRELLGVERVAPRDNFFEIGGNSLVAIKALARLRQSFGIELPLQTLFDHPTVKELAGRIMAQGGASSNHSAKPAKAEELILAVWQDILGIENIGRLDNFFDIGGNSLTAIRVVSRLQKEFNLDIPLEVLFNHPRAAELAATILPSDSCVADQAPANSSGVEQEIVRIWRKLLGIEPQDVKTNFFEIGGNSLMAIKVVSHLRDTFRIEVPIEVVFNCPSVAELANAVRTISGDQKAAGTGVAGSADSECEPNGVAINPALPRQHKTVQFPMSYSQYRLWFLNQLDKDSTEYNLPEVVRFRGKLDKNAVAAATNAIVRRHEILRTRFAEQNGEAMQIVEPELHVDLPIEDLSRLGEDAQQERIDAAMEREWQVPFDLERVPLLRMRLLKLGEEDHVLLRTFHHIVSDGWSYSVFNREFGLLYDAILTGRKDSLDPLPMQYSDFTLWQRERLDRSALDRDLNYWTHHLAGCPEELELPKDRPRGRVQTFLADSCPMVLNSPQVDALRTLASTHNCTAYMTLLSLLMLLLHFHSGQEDILVGSPVANRLEEQLEQLVGCFVNVLVMRGRIDSACTFRELLFAIRSTILDAFNHRELPFERLVEELAPRRALNRHPLYQITFALHNMLMTPPRLHGLEVSPVFAKQPRVRFDLELQAWDQDGQIKCLWIYNRDLFDPWRIEQMSSHFLRLLEQAAANPETPLFAMSLLNLAERQQILAGWNQTAQPMEDISVCDLFHQRVAQHPDAVALTFPGKRLTFAELNARANQLARYLRTRGVGPEVVVGLALDPSTEIVISMLAVLKAGGAYLPLEMSYPAERIAFMVADGNVPVVLTTRAFQDRLSAGFAQVICLDEEEEIQNELTDNIAIRSQPDNAAYVIYTSGSTGEPKGVVVTCRGLMNYLLWARSAYTDDHGAGVLVHTSINFDLTVTSIYVPILAGKAVMLLPRNDTASLTSGLKCHNDLSILKLTPAHVDALNGTLFQDEFKNRVRCLVIGGEALNYQTVAAWRTYAPETRIVNEYGPTEAVVGCCAYEVQPHDPSSGAIPIGKPICNTQLYVLNGNLEPVPVGIVGEIYISGMGVARGYIRKPRLTAERFVANPYAENPGSRMYRTGDLARWRTDGILEFLGRNDQQLKIRGFRVELGEIESAMRRHPRVKDAVAALYQGDGGERLVGYIVLRDGSPERDDRNTPQASTEFEQVFMDRLRESLPEYMVPSALVLLDALPLTANGKVDRRALPAPGTTRDRIFRAPTTQLQAALCSIFAEVLELEKVGLDDDFFVLGGHSLAATRVVGRVRTLLGIGLELQVLFDRRTVAELAAHLEHYQPISPAAEYASPAAVQRAVVKPA